LNWIPAITPIARKQVLFAVFVSFRYFDLVTEEERKFLKRAVKNGLRMQHRFTAEAVLAKTGKGLLKSEGVNTLQRIKANLKKSTVRKRSGENS
jgi:hypothetical protein